MLKFLLLFIIFLIIYLIPSYVGRKRSDFRRIFILNLFLGWTFVGWVVALIWAVGDDSR
jgi:prepilin signal peptidase PulO-like enzyme (type II secretory pathway)